MVIIFIYKAVVAMNTNKKENRKINIKDKIPILIVALFPYIWYILLANHTKGHIRFTYRNMMIFLFGTLIFINEVLNIIKQKIMLKTKNKDV